MSASPIFPRADKAAREVDPMLLAQALDHIAKSAAKSRTSTRRLRWIEQRAIFALEGREYRDTDLDLPKDSPGTSIERNARRIAYLLSALHRIKALGPTPSVQQIVDEALGIAEAQNFPADVLPARDTIVLGTREPLEGMLVLDLPPVEDDQVQEARHG